MGSFPGERQCEYCECMFVDRDDAKVMRCKSCRTLPQRPVDSKPFVHQEVSRDELASRVAALEKQMAKLLTKDKEPKSYSKKCETCNAVFVSEQPATRYCDDCKAAKS
jgi:hypothetical protein